MKSLHTFYMEKKNESSRIYGLNIQMKSSHTFCIGKNEYLTINISNPKNSRIQQTIVDQIYNIDVYRQIMVKTST